MTETPDTPAGKPGLAQWRDSLPTVTGWLRLISTPSTYALAVALLLTMWAKASVLSEIGGLSLWPLVALGTVGLDAAVYMGLAAMIAVVEARTRWLMLATYPLAILALAAAAINARVLSVTGEQLTWEAIELGVDRFSDLVRITVEGLAARLPTLVVGAIAVVGIPIGGARLLARRAPASRRETAHRSAHCALAVAALGSLIWAATLAVVDTMIVQRFAGNAPTSIYWQQLSGIEVAPRELEVPPFSGYHPPHMVEPEAIAALGDRVKSGSAPNVLIVILESTRSDHTELVESDRWRGTRTPALKALADRGMWTSRAYPVLPHTTKSVFAMLCGRFPTMQWAIAEFSAALQVECVPSIATAAGYRSAFFQSAWGRFEERPRLVDKLGFDHFAAWEDIQGESLGYLASDDESLAPPFAQWLDDADGARPFFAALLTSATHHPYRLSRRAAERSARSGSPAATDEQRYARLVEASDFLLAELVQILEQRGLDDNTIIVVAGDHGEGFGEKGVRQHDNNFFEEGLRSPLVIVGPNVTPQELPGPVSLADIAPTLLSLLQVPLAPAATGNVIGIDLTGTHDPDRVVVFGCFYELRCRGWIQGTTKVVFSPERALAFLFDLAADPDEHEPKRLPQEMYERISSLNRVIDSHRNPGFPRALGPTRPYGDWSCLEGSLCTHPNQQPFPLELIGPPQPPPGSQPAQPPSPASERGL